MKTANDMMREALDEHYCRIDDIGDEIETSREALREATREHNARVGKLERERATLQREAGNFREALKAIDTSNLTGN